MTELVGYLLLFLVVAVVFVFFHLMMGKMIRPAKPDSEKLTIYECGEPTIGSSWIQFDLRFYVVALLFVIFEVEAVFFFPWAVVFGKANVLANPDTPPAVRREVSEQLLPEYKLRGVEIEPEGGQQLGLLAFWDILVFFGVLLVGFAYLWKRGDLDWVRRTVAETPSTRADQVPLPPSSEAPAPLVGAGQH